MITYDEMREKYPPQQVSTQQEFDQRMNALRREQTEILQPLKQESDELNHRRHEIGRQMAELNIELGNVNRRREEIRDECREVGTIFYGLKKELIRLNPKVVPPTCRDDETTAE